MTKEPRVSTSGFWCTCLLGALALSATMAPATRAADRMVVGEEFSATW